MPKPTPNPLSEMFYVAESGIHGQGLFARSPLKKGSFLGTYKGPECTDIDNSGPYVLWLETEEGSWLGRDGRNILRYLNHHERPSAEFDGFELYALQDIAPPPGSDHSLWRGVCRGDRRNIAGRTPLLIA